MTDLYWDLMEQQQYLIAKLNRYIYDRKKFDGGKTFEQTKILKDGLPKDRSINSCFKSTLL